MILVNSSIFLSGKILFLTISNLKRIVILGIPSLFILLIYLKTKKYYCSSNIIDRVFDDIYLIIKSIISNHFIPIIFYIIEISLFIMLYIIGVMANLKDYKVH